MFISPFKSIHKWLTPNKSRLESTPWHFSKVKLDYLIDQWTLFGASHEILMSACLTWCKQYCEITMLHWTDFLFVNWNHDYKWVLAGIFLESNIKISWDLEFFCIDPIIDIILTVLPLLQTGTTCSILLNIVHNPLGTQPWCLCTEVA